MSHRIMMTIVAAILCAGPLAAQPVKVDPRLPRYEPPREKITGSFSCTNVDTLTNLLTLWAEQLLIHFPDMMFQIEGKGRTPFHELTHGRTQVAGESRPWSADQAKLFREKWGYDATPLRVGINVIAIFVHKDNPIAKKGLTLQQLDAIFGKDRKRGAPADIRTWGDLGLEGEWKDKPIAQHGRNTASAAYHYVKVNALAAGRFKDEVTEQSGSSRLVEAVGKDRFAIGYTVIGFKSEDVATVPLAADSKSNPTDPFAKDVTKYPLSHYFYLYVNHKPGTTLPVQTREFLRFAYSANGQQDVIRDGLLPIDAETAKEEAAKVGLTLELKADGAEAAPAKAEPMFGPVKVDPRLPKYEKSDVPKGTLLAGGSDSLNNLLAIWFEEFKFTHSHDHVEVDIPGKGSSTGHAMLLGSFVDFGSMSRPMKPQELAGFKAKFGHEPTPLRVARDMLAVYVHKDNPIAKTGLTLQQVDAVFSKTRSGGAAADAKVWGDVGLTGEWADKPIVVFGRNSASFTYGFFKDTALFKGDFKDDVKEQPGSSAVVAGVSSDRFAIGYSGLSYRTDGVVAIPLALNDKSDFVPADPEKFTTYPLGRYLYLYVNHKPGTTLPPIQLEFLRYVFSAQGQLDVIRDGYTPIDAETAKEDAAEVGLKLELRPEPNTPVKPKD